MGPSRLGKLLPRGKARLRRRRRANSSAAALVAATSEQHTPSNMGNGTTRCQGTGDNAIPVLLQRNGSRRTKPIPRDTWNSSIQDFPEYLLLGPTVPGLQPPTPAPSSAMRMPSLRPHIMGQHQWRSKPTGNRSSAHCPVGSAHHEKRRTIIPKPRCKRANSNMECDSGKPSTGQVRKPLSGMANYTRVEH